MEREGIVSSQQVAGADPAKTLGNKTGSRNDSIP